jgi:hypothetical protein
VDKNENHLRFNQKGVSSDISQSDTLEVNYFYSFHYVDDFPLYRRIGNKKFKHRSTRPRPFFFFQQTDGEIKRKRFFHA